ncbi:MAG: hypothetical protein FWG85_04855 [Bacteroidetes bacterium]|nr:hypothetical protein [Bacteroidota bacterium]
MLQIKTNYFFSFVLLFTFIVNTNIVLAQEDDEYDVPAAEKYIRDKYIEYYEADFDAVFNAVKQYLLIVGAEIERDATADNDLGLKKGMIRSNIVVLTQKKDSAFKVIQKYSFRPPFIRGGVWTSARVQYKVLLNDDGDGKISVVFENEFSGFEDHATFKVHFFKTNGLLEFEGFEALTDLIEKNR